MTTKNIAIVGAGLVGSLLAIYLRKRGYAVSVFERRPDMRSTSAYAGKSINLALSNRGIKALEEVGLADALRQVAIPMHGRMIHDIAGKLSFMPYGKQGQFINSISRGGLNCVLMDKAEEVGANFFFEKKITHTDLDNTTLLIDGKAQSFDLIIGADGAYSVIRSAMQVTDRFQYQQFYIDHGYKELVIPPAAAGAFRMEKNALHIWPRESFMLIALPNPDGTFTCTLFFPFEGTPSFNSLKTEHDVKIFFEETFPDAVALMPTLLQDFQHNPTASLVTIRCYPWVKNKTLLIGDAAHGIVPFYGQGMNAGFEDCRVLNQLLDQFDDNWALVLPAFQELRKKDADAIAQLALDNFIEMRDLVADPQFILQKKIEAHLHELYPDRWKPLYSMVTFYDDMRYSDALRIGTRQKEIMAAVLKKPGIESNWQQLDFESIVNQL